MAEQTPPAQPAFDLEALGKTIATATAAAVAEAMKPVHEAIGKLSPPSAAAPAAPAAPAPAAQEKPGGRAVTIDEVRQLLQEAGTQQRNSAARETFAAQKLKDLPQVYRNQLGNDPAKWEAEEQKIRQGFRDDLKAAGIQPTPNVGTQTAGGAGTGGPINRGVIDTSKLNPLQKIALGLGYKRAPVEPAVPQGAVAAAAK